MAFSSEYLLAEATRKRLPEVIDALRDLSNLLKEEPLKTVVEKLTDDAANTVADLDDFLIHDLVDIEAALTRLSANL